MGSVIGRDETDAWDRRVLAACSRLTAHTWDPVEGGGSSAGRASSGWVPTSVPWSERDPSALDGPVTHREQAELAGVDLGERISREPEEIGGAAPEVVAGGDVEDFVPGLLPDARSLTGLVELITSGALEEVGRGSLSGQELLEVCAAFAQAEAWAAAGLRAAAARLHERSPRLAQDWVPGRVQIRGRGAEELSVRLGVSPQKAGKVMAQGVMLAGGLAPVREALASGAIDSAKAAAFTEALLDQPLEVCLAVCEEVLPKAPLLNHSALGRELSRAVVAVDARGAAERHRAARANRRVSGVTARADGMGSMTCYAPLPDLAALDAALEASARASRAEGDERTIDQLRADTLTTMAISALAAGAPTFLLEGAASGTTTVRNRTQAPADSMSDAGTSMAAWNHVNASGAWSDANASGAPDDTTGEGGPARAEGTSRAVTRDRPPGRGQLPSRERDGGGGTGAAFGLDVTDHESVPVLRLPSGLGGVGARFDPGRTRVTLHMSDRHLDPAGDRAPHLADSFAWDLDATLAQHDGAPPPGVEHPGHPERGSPLHRETPLHHGTPSGRLGDADDGRNDRSGSTSGPSDRGVVGEAGLPRPAPHSRGVPSHALTGSEIPGRHAPGGRASRPAPVVPELTGIGPLSPDVARALAADPPRWLNVVVAQEPSPGSVCAPGSTRPPEPGSPPDTAPDVGPDTGPEDAAEANRGSADCLGAAGYAIPEWLHRLVKTAHPTCAVPTCHVPSQRCDTDHVAPWPKGATCTCNLRPLCRRHHGLKTHHGFGLSIDPDGSIRWTTPLGQVVTASPAGVLRRHRPRYLAPDRRGRGAFSRDSLGDAGTAPSSAA